MRKVWVGLTGILLLLATAGWAVGKAGEPKQYPVPGHGKLQVTVPAGWTAEILPSPKEGLPQTILFTPSSGPLFRLLVTPVGSPTGVPGFNTPDWIKSQITHIRDLRLATAAEKETPLHELRSRSGPGYWFAITDPAPKPGEYEHLTQGALPAGDLCVSFTVLTHTAPPEGVADALALLASVEQVK
jgi:hypothetical protein